MKIGLLPTLTVAVPTAAAVHVFAFLVSCGPSCPPSTPSTPDVVEADAGADVEEVDAGPDGLIVVATATCGTACANLRARGCQEATTRPSEDSCEVVCQRATDTRRIDLHLACLARARNALEVRACGTFRCTGR